MSTKTTSLWESMPLGVSSPRNKAPIDIILDGMPYIDIPGAFVNSGDFYPPVWEVLVPSIPKTSLPTVLVVTLRESVTRRLENVLSKCFIIQSESFQEFLWKRHRPTESIPLMVLVDTWVAEFYTNKKTIESLIWRMKSTTGALLALRLYNSSSVVIPTRQEGEVFDGNISKNAEPEIFMDKLCELFAQVSLDRRDEFDGIFAQLTACNDPLDGATEQALYPELIEA